MFLIFYDSTTFSQDNFKKYGWAFRKNNINIIKKFRYSGTHLLSIISKENLISNKFIKGNLNNLDIIYFFIQSLQKIYLKAGKKKLY